MPVTQTDRQCGDAVAGAYDALAASYDAQVAADAALRAALWRRYTRLFRPGERILDVGCGTGIDALHLAQRGHSVVAVDASAGMLAELRRKADAQGLAGRIAVRQLDAGELASLPDSGFDGLIAAFAVLNTVPDLAAFAVAAARLLRPGGRVLIHLLNAAPWPRQVRLLLRGRARDWRALRCTRERVVTLGGATVRHLLYSPAEAERAFAPHFRVMRAYGMGVLAPTAASALPPRIVRTLAQLESAIARREPLLGGGRFYALELRKRYRPLAGG